MTSVTGHIFQSAVFRFFRHSFAGWISPALAVIALVGLELVRYAISDYSLNLTEIFLVSGFITALAFVYALSFTLIYIISRNISLLLQRIRSVWTNAGPGLIIFLLILEPFMAHFFPDSKTDRFSVITASYATLILLISIPLFFYIRSFPGFSLTFFLFSLLFSRVLLYQIHFVSSPFYFILSHSAFVIMSILIFTALYYRHKIYLLSGFDRYKVSGWVISIYFIIFMVLTAALLFFWPIAGPDNQISFINMLQPDPEGSLLYICSYFAAIFAWILIIQIILSSLNIIYINRYQSGGFLYHFLSVLALWFIITPVTALTLLSLPGTTGNLIYSPSAQSLLYIMAEKNDKDQDGNSAWPGSDPDDTNPCIRIDMEFLKKLEKGCASDSEPMKILSAGTEEKEESQNKRKSKTKKISRLASKSNLTIITYNVPVKKNSYYPVFSEADHKSRVLLAGNSVPIALNGLFRLSDSRFLFEDDIKSGFFSNINKLKYRTICIVHSKNNYFKINLHGQKKDSAPNKSAIKSVWGAYTSFGEDSDYKLDQGCQVFINASPDKYTSLQQVTELAEKQISLYKENRNIFWMHYDGENDGKTGESADHSQILTEFINNQLNFGDVIVVNMNLPEIPIAEVFTFHLKGKKSELDESDEIDELDKSLNTSIKSDLEQSLGIRIIKDEISVEEFTGVSQITEQNYGTLTLQLLNSEKTDKKKLPLRTYRITEHNTINYFYSMMGLHTITRLSEE
jgi:hypothetical protein